MSLPVIVLGAGGHTKVLIETLQATSAEITGIVDPDPKLAGSSVHGIQVVGDDDAVSNYSPLEILLVNGIGSTYLPVKRQRLFDRFKEMGYHFATIVHPSAVLASDVELGEGAQIMAGAVLQTGSCIGCNTIINTSASVDHDCNIGDHVHIAPGVTLSGNVKIGNGTHVGTAATVIQGIGIGAESVIGAGALVLKNVKQFQTVAGVPAKKVNI